MDNLVQIETDLWSAADSLRADTAMRVSAKPNPRSHLAGHLRSERQLLANPPFNDSDWFLGKKEPVRKKRGASELALAA